jgi:hypothetical protein
MSSVITFCELHGLTRMLNLLRHSAPLTTTQEVFAIELLEEQWANVPDKMAALVEIKKAVHPVEKARQFRATLLAQDAELSTLRQSILELQQMHQGTARKSARTEGEDNTQLLQDAQVPDSGDESQPDEAGKQFDLLKRR